MSSTCTETEKDFQSKTSLKGRKYLSDITTGAHSALIGCTILGLATSYPLGQRQNLLFFIMSLHDVCCGAYSQTCRSWFLFFHCLRLTHRICPWDSPAKNPNIERREGDGPPVRPMISPATRLISGRDAYFPGLNPSELLALHKTRPSFCVRRE